MQRRLQLPLLLSVIVAFVCHSHDAAAGGRTTTRLRVEGMTCGGCATAVKIVLQRESGVIDADVSFEQKLAVVTYDPTKTSPETLAKVIASKLKYQVRQLDGASVVTSAAMSSTATCDLPARAPVASTGSITLPTYRPDSLRSAFNKESSRVRVVALLSPTCGACQHGQDVVRSIFSTFPADDRLRGFVVWLPMLPGDGKKAAEAQAGVFTDTRLAQQWDGDRVSGDLLAKTLKLNRTAWDVYLIYASGVTWNGETPPPPTFWMHQLRPESGADQRVCLNPAVLLSKVRELVTAKARKG